MKKQRIIFAAIFWLSMSVHAGDLGAAVQAAKDFGNQTLTQPTLPSSQIPLYQSTAPQTSLFGQVGVMGAAVNKVNGCKSYTPSGTDKVGNQECEAVNFLAKNPDARIKVNINKNDSIFSIARQTATNPNDLLKSMGFDATANNGSSCTTTSTTEKAVYKNKTCYDSLNGQKDICVYGRDISVDADSNYLCQKTTKQNKQYNCDRGTTVSCAGDGCDPGGIIGNSWDGDMATYWFASGGGNYILQFGTIADNYWGDGQYDRVLRFTIKDKSKITLFSLTRAAFDDWLWVKVNGNTVYVGPYGGDRVELNCQIYYDDFGYREVCGGFFSTVTYCNGCTSRAELGTSWNIGLNINLIPYLNNGVNEIWMRTVVAGGGEGAIQITARQKCPCSISTSNNCIVLENRAK